MIQCHSESQGHGHRSRPTSRVVGSSGYEACPFRYTDSLLVLKNPMLDYLVGYNRPNN